MSATVYASRLRRLPILAPDGGAVGVVADVVIGPPADDQPPAVYGLVATVPGRRIFIGAGRIAQIEADGVHLRSGALNLRRFSQRPAERLAIAELLDRQLENDSGWVNDLGIGPSPRRASAWEVKAVDVVTLPPRRLGRRRGRHRTVGPEVLRPLLGDPDRHHHFRDLLPADAAERLAMLTAQQRVAAAQNLDDEQLADLIEELPHEAQARLLTDLGIERGTDVLEAMEPDDAADVLADLTPEGRARLLAGMEDGDAAVIRRLLAYDQDTAGGLMNPEPIICTATTTVAEALVRLRDPDAVPAMAAHVFVVEPPAQTPTGRYLGGCSVQRLLREPPGRRLRACIDPAPDALDPTTPVTAVAHHLAAYNLVVAPTVDRRGRLVGAVTVDDVLDHILPDDWRRR